MFILAFPWSGDHKQDWQPYPVDPYSALSDDHTIIHTHIRRERSPGSVDEKVRSFRAGEGLLEVKDGNRRHLACAGRSSDMSFRVHIRAIGTVEY